MAHPNPADAGRPSVSRPSGAQRWSRAAGSVATTPTPPVKVPPAHLLQAAKGGKDPTRSTTPKGKAPPGKGPTFGKSASPPVPLPPPPVVNRGRQDIGGVGIEPSTEAQFQTLCNLAIATLFPADNEKRAGMMQLWDSCDTTYQFYSILARNHHFPNIVAPSNVDTAPDAFPHQGTANLQPRRARRRYRGRGRGRGNGRRP